VLLAVDDVQWLDAASARVLEFALRRLRDERVGVLLRVAGRGAGARGPGGSEERMFGVPPADTDDDHYTPGLPSDGMGSFAACFGR
jgi:hypothetical protein